MKLVGGIVSMTASNLRNIAIWSGAIRRLTKRVARNFVGETVNFE